MAEAGDDDPNVAITQDLHSATIDDTVIARNHRDDEDVPVHIAVEWQGSGRKCHNGDVDEAEYPGPNGTPSTSSVRPECTG